MGFALRTTVAALLALVLAESFGILHPWWAAMTVWLVAQPTRGLLLERSLARLAGTVCGACAGALILSFLAGHWLPALTVLAAWLALCAGLGSVFRHFRNYGFVLAGYTAAIVVLFGLGGHADPGLALDRIVCTVIGILASTLVSFHALPCRRDQLAARADDLGHRAMARVEAFLLGREMEPPTALLSAIGAFDRAIEDGAAGSVEGRRAALRARHVSGVLLELIALTGQRKSPDAITSPALEGAEGPAERIRGAVTASMAAGQFAIAAALDELGRALMPAGASRVPLQIDVDPWSVWRAAARPVLALAIAAVAWQVSGWPAGALMAMTATLFTSLFSSHDQGNQMVVQVLMGTLAGAIAGTAVRLFLLPQVTGLLPTLMCITPFLLAGAWLMRRQATAKLAIDLTMTFLLTAQPGSAPAEAATTLSEAAAMVAGVLIAAATFWLIVPATPEVRRRLLANRIARLTLSVAGSADQATAEAAHNGLRMAQVRLLDFTAADSATFRAAQTCLAAASMALAARGGGSHTFGGSVPASRAGAPTVLQAVATLHGVVNSNQRRNSQ